MNMLNLSNIFALIVLHELGYSNEKDEDRELELERVERELMEAVFMEVMEKVPIKVIRQPKGKKGVQAGQIDRHREEDEVKSSITSEMFRKSLGRQKDLEAAVLRRYMQLKEHPETF